MSQFERLHRIKQIIDARRVVPFATLMDELEVSRATLKRDLAKLRDEFNAPIEFDRDAGGYRFGKVNGGPKFELPGLWFSAEEILALMSMYRMLEATDESGLLGQHIKPLMTRLTQLMEDSTDGSANEILKRVKLISVQRRRVDPKVFETIGAAVARPRARCGGPWCDRSRRSRGAAASPARRRLSRTPWGPRVVAAPR